MNRRKFIHTAAWSGAACMAAPRLHAETPSAEEPVIVSIQLSGGCDGLNTVVPINNDDYHAARPNLSIKPAAALSINSSVGLHPGLRGLQELYGKGDLAIIQGVGYPDSCRSHFRAAQIWRTASGCTGPAAIDTPQSRAILKNAKPGLPFPATPLAQELKTVSQLIRGGMPLNIYHLSRGGFDTHTHQAGTHAALMKEIGDALLAFNLDLENAGRSRRVAVIVYSEFGRSLKENSFGGTDHGAAAPVFVIGSPVKGGLYGRQPSLAPGQLIHGAPAHTTDCRSVYAALLKNHMGIDSKTALPEKLQPLSFI